MDVVFEGVRFERGRKLVLDVPALSFAAGRVTALMGPNGAGKSTLLRLIAGLERPAAGLVRVGGQPVRSRTAGDALAYCFQSPVFLSGTVRSNLDLALRLRKLPPPERERRIAAVAEACGIGHLLEQGAHRISGGEAQRANLARALALRAPVTLLDEPLAGLDARSREQLVRELPGLLEGFTTTAIVVTHERDEAARFGHEVVLLQDGRVLAAGARAQLFRAPPSAAAARMLGFTLVTTDAGLVAIAPRSLVLGDGDVGFDLAVTRVTDLGIGWEVEGTIGATPVTIDVLASPPGVGQPVRVSAPAEAVVRF